MLHSALELNWIREYSVGLRSQDGPVISFLMTIFFFFDDNGPVISHILYADESLI